MLLVFGLVHWDGSAECFLCLHTTTFSLELAVCGLSLNDSLFVHHQQF